MIRRGHDRHGPHLHRRWIAVMALAAALLVPGAAHAATVDVGVSSREAYVGTPVVLTITIENATSHEPPVVPPIDGATVRPAGGPSRSSMTEIVNGRVTQRSSLAYRYRVTPTRPGLITIPALEVTADGKTFASRAFEIIAVPAGRSAGDADGNLLAVEVAADRKSVHLGESVNVTLTVWIRPYRDRRFNRTLRDGEMWSRIRVQDSTWGRFAETVQEMDSRQRRPAGQQVLLDDGTGRRRAFYRFEITRTIWPEQAGRLDLEDVTVVVDYPTQLRRDFFDLRVADFRRIAASAASPTVEVVPPPEEGRPALYRGAVGRFDVVAEAKPVEVAVGDPITLMITITDRSPRESQLEMLRPPALREVEALTADFRIPADPLSGLVEGRRKTFTQTIRATHDGVERIPPIPFSFFDPKRSAYETVRTDPIPITVSASPTLALTDIVEAERSSENGATALTEVAGGLLASYAEPEAALASQSIRPGPAMLAVLLTAPALFVAAAVTRHVGRRDERDPEGRRRRGAARRALSRIRRDPSGDVQRQAETIASAVRDYVCDRRGRPAGSLTRAEVDTALRERDVPDDVVHEIESLLRRCEACCYAGSTDGDATDLVDRARRAILRLERERLS